MGEVYLAQDPRLGRTVALKVLPASVADNPEVMRRFLQEARAAAAVHHPHVAHIYEIGEAGGTNFIVMEHVDGQTLDVRINGSPLDINELVEIGIETADALAEAHAKGITHRDIKPSNIMVTPRAGVKVLDFGLAKITTGDTENAGSDFATAIKTTPGAAMGTLAYMSPEQALGREVDHRTDIFSLGVVLYEMASGKRPFAGKTPTETIDHIAHAQPEAMARFNYNITAELERIIRKCLEKNRERRYQSARELVLDLENLRRDSAVATGARLDLEPARFKRRLILAAVVLAILGAGVALVLLAGRSKTTIDSVAVLPLVNMGGDSGTEYLSDGITESLINRLSQLPHMKVIARSSVFRYKGRDVDTQTVGRELGVGAMLTGRVVQSGDNILISVELVDTQDDSQLWGERYNRKLSDLLAVQDEIVRHILEKLRFELKGEQQQQLAKRYTNNTEAYQLYLLGRFHWNKFTEQGALKSIDYFNQALAKDPNYALAYFGLSDAYQLLGQIGFRPNEVCPKSLFYADKALAVDPSLPEAHFARGAYELWYGWNWTIAEQELKRAMEPNTNVSGAHDLYGQFLSGMGRFDEAIAQSKRAVELDPLSPIANSNLGFVYYYAHQYDLAIEQNRKVMELDTNFLMAPLNIGWAYGQQGKYPEAIAQLIKTRDLPGGFVTATSELGYVYAVSGQRTKAQEHLRELQQRAKREFIDPYYIAIVYVGLGDLEQTFTWLNKAYEERSFWLLSLNVEPKFERLHSDPRYQDLRRRMNLPS
jgi:serine/threonine-protein kinase